MPTKQEANAAAQQELQRVVRAHAAHAPSAAATADADADLLRAIRGFMSNNDWAEKIPTPNFSTALFAHTTITHASRGTLRARFPALACYANAFGTLAGGAQALAHDYVTGWALLTVAQQGYWETLGVTESLAVRYLRPVRVGEGVGLESEIVKVGKRSAVLRGVLRRERDGEIVSISEHVKSDVGGGGMAKL